MIPKKGDIWKSAWHPPHLLLELNRNFEGEWHFWALRLDNGQQRLLIFRTGGSWTRVA